MEHNRLSQHEAPRDPELAEAFEAFIQQTTVPLDFHTRVMARVQQRRSRRGRWGWSERWWTWWTHDWSPLGVWAATVCALLSLAFNLGLGYYTWKHRQAITALGQELTATRAQMHQAQADQHQLAALQEQVQRAIQDSAALRHELTTAQLQVHAAQAESHQWQDRLTELTNQLAALQQQAQRQTHQAQEPAGAPAPSTSMPAAVEDVRASSSPALARDRVRAKVGIQVHSGEHTASAKTTETVKTGDFLRVYVVPEGEAYVYVVHNDGENVTLLNAQNATTKVTKGELVTLPAPEQFYQINGRSEKESITVLCSPTELYEVASLFSGPNVTQHNWLSLEKALLDKSKIDLSQPTDKPLRVAGNVRAMNNNDPFLNTLVIYSGKSLVAKKYDFQVQK